MRLHLELKWTIGLCHKVIGRSAFFGCVNLDGVELPVGLEQLGERAFRQCTSLQSINIPPMVKSIERHTFRDCVALQNVDLSEGLKIIGREAFVNCPLLRHITIPSTVKRITPDAFICSFWMNPILERVQFCDEIEELVSGESLRDWWDNGTSERSLRTYNFLVRRDIPARLEQLIVRQWQANVIEMLRSIPDDLAALDGHLTAITTKLAFYEFLEYSTSLLELAIWKSEICAQHGPNIGNVSGEKKSQCRDNCGACVIIPNVLLFITIDLPSL